VRDTAYAGRHQAAARGGSNGRRMPRMSVLLPSRTCSLQQGSTGTDLDGGGVAAAGAAAVLAAAAVAVRRSVCVRGWRSVCPQARETEYKRRQPRRLVVHSPRPSPPQPAPNSNRAETSRLAARLPGPNEVCLRKAVKHRQKTKAARMETYQIGELIAVEENRACSLHALRQYAACKPGRMIQQTAAEEGRGRIAVSDRPAREADAGPARLALCAVQAAVQLRLRHATRKGPVAVHGQALLRSGGYDSDFKISVLR